MLEEYVCLGGNEVANNARAYGYATTAGCPLTWFRCEPCESIHDVTSDWIPPTFRTYQVGVNLFPDPRFTVPTYINAGASWSLTFPEARFARVERTLVGAGQILNLVVGTEMPNSSKGVTLRFTATASETFTDIVVAARPNVASTTGEWAIASVTIPEGTNVFELTGPSFAGSSSTSTSGFALIDNAPTTNVGATLEISEVTVAPRGDLTFTETRRNYAVGTGAYWSRTTGTAVKTEGGAVTPSVLVATNLMIDPSARNAGVAGVAFNTDTAVSGAILTRVDNPPALPGAGHAAHFDITTGTYRLGFVTRTDLAINTTYTLRFRMAGNPTTAADGVMLSLNYRPGGAGASTNQVPIGTFPARATESVVQATFTTLANVPLSSAGIFFIGTNGSGANGTLDITEVTLVQGTAIPATVAPFFDGSTEPPPGYAVAWTGTPDASSSTVTLLPVTVEANTLRLTQTVAGNTAFSDSFSVYPLGVTSGTVMMPVTAGQVVRMRAQWRGNDRRTARYVLRWRDAGGTITDTIVQPAPPAPPLGEWGEMEFAMPPAPAGAASFEWRINSWQATSPANVPQGFETGDWMEFRNLQASIDQELGAFFNGGTLAPDGDTQYFWAGTAQASQSVEAQLPVLPALPAYFDGDSVEPTPDDNIFWAGVPNASTSIWERTSTETPGQAVDPPYLLSNIESAPWYDAQYSELTSRFYGVFLLSIENLNSSTRTATVTEGILDGGVVGLVRHSTREMRVRALLSADGEDALEYGLAWLNAALAADGCGTHGSSCGAVDMSFFAACPPLPDPNSTITVDPIELRSLHNVTVTSGPLVEQKIKSNDQEHYGYIVEWTMVAGTPWVFSPTREVTVNLQPPVVVQDVPYNLVPFPSAELSNGTVTLATNYVTNPSIETDASGWSVGTNGVTPAPTGARSTEIAASGTASYKVSVTTTNSAVQPGGSIYAIRDVALPAFVAGRRFSITTWLAAFVISGTAVLNGTRLRIEWRDASSTVRNDTIGTGLVSGGTITATGIAPPDTAITARIVAIADIGSWSVGAQVNLFVDAVALTIP